MTPNQKKLLLAISGALAAIIAAIALYIQSEEAEVPPPPPAGSAVFVAEDVTTKGTWIGQFGSDGYLAHGIPASMPAFAAVSLADKADYIWADAVADVRALQKPGAADRIAPAWYGNAFTAQVAISDGSTRKISLYFLDWDRTGRAVKVDASVNGSVVDTRNVSDFGEGKWLTWDVSGTVTFQITNAGPTNAVLSGIFIGGAGAPRPPPTATVSVSPASIEDSHDGSHQATLTWATTNATDVKIGAEAVAASGSRVIAAPPLGTHTYTLTATGAGGTATAIATLTVVPHQHAPDPTLPHPDDLAKQAEHLAAMALVPAATANLHVPVGTVRELSGDVEFLKIRVEGILRLLPGCTLRTETMIGVPGAKLEIGTATNPVTMASPVRILIRDTGPIDPATDPLMLSRGIVWHSAAASFAEVVDPFALPIAPPLAGNTVLNFQTLPAGWAVGQTIVVGDMSREYREKKYHEVRTITAVVDATVRLSAPLEFDHQAIKSEEPLAWTGANILAESVVGNLSRPITIESENKTDVSRRGHVMWMHSNAVALNGVAFVGLGRTDKRQVATDPKVDGTGRENPRGRYPCHFHRAGGKLSETPATVTNFAIWDGPGLGLVNHSSHVVATKGCTFDVLGSHLFGEDGDEIGLFADCLCLFSAGSGRQGDVTGDPGPRFPANDFGDLGHGVWTQDGGIKLKNIRAGGHRAAAIALFGRFQTATAFPVSNLDPHLRAIVPAGTTHLAPHQVPNVVEDCTSWGSGEGLNTWAIANLPAFPDRTEFDSQITRCRLVNRVVHGYSGHFHYRDTFFPELSHTLINYGNTYERIHMEGTVLAGPMEDFNESDRTFPTHPGRPTKFIGGTFKTQRGIYLSNTQYRKRTVIADGNQRFIPISGATGQQDWHSSLEYFLFQFNVLATSPDPALYRALLGRLTHPLDTTKIGDRWLSPRELDPDYSWDWVASLPAALKKTTGELNAMGLYPGGRKLPATVERRERVYGVLHADPSVPVPDLSVLSLTKTDDENYTARVRNQAGEEVRHGPVALAMGLNVVTIPDVDGIKRGVLVERLAKGDPITGSWPGQYGSKGYAIPGGAEEMPAGASARFLKTQYPLETRVNEFPTADATAIPASKDTTLRIKSRWAGGYEQTMEVRPNGATKLTLYYRDFGWWGGPAGTLQALVYMTGPDGKVIGEPITTTDFAAGKYVTLNLPAGIEFVRLILTKPHTVGGEFTLSGVFLD